jgi:glycosyltransferase XagB
MLRPVPFTPTIAAERPVQLRRLLGETLVEAGVVAPDALAAALADQADQDAPLGRILLAASAITPDDLLRGLARQTELMLVDLLASPPAPELFDGLDPGVLLELEAVPWREVGGTRIIAISNPGAMAAASELLGAGAERVAVVLTRADDIRRTVVARFDLSMRDGASTRCPVPYSCRPIASPRFRWRALAGAGALAGVAIAAPMLALQALMVWIILMNGLTMGLRLAAIFARFRVVSEPAAPPVPRLSDYQKLPTVSLLVPLKGEASIVADLMSALSALDYPKALLDVKIVVEESDLPTRLALDPATLPSHVEIVTVPRDHRLETKPRALNYALPFCRGAIVGVYDAEDRPDPEQIRAVVRALQAAPPEVACVQGYLDFYNPNDNWLSRCFTIEYAMWFRVLLHGVQRLGIPIPLGGTTVFFRRRVLEEIGAWDAHNVTEDADLGMRLARFGYRCEMIASTTLEEANCHPRRWIRQRARWLKGYAITWTTHMRRPAALVRDLGWRGFLGFQVLFLGAITSYLSLPLFWGIAIAAYGIGLDVWKSFPAPLSAAFLASMVFGQVVMLSVAVLALRDSGRSRMIPWIVTLPLYWPLGAVAAYRAIAEIFTSPFYWHKTEHGFAKMPAGRSVSSRGAV